MGNCMVTATCLSACLLLQDPWQGGTDDTFIPMDGGYGGCTAISKQSGRYTLPAYAPPLLISMPQHLSSSISLRNVPGLFPPDSTPCDLSSLYTLREKLGSGAFATVRRCISVGSSDGAEFACKSIDKRILRSAADRDCVLREVSHMKKLGSRSSDNSKTAEAAAENSIIKLHEVVEDADSVHLIMELCHGGSLDDRMRRRKNKYGPLESRNRRVFTEAETANIMRSVLEALKACHSHGIIHRDVKPGNILFVDESDNSAVRLADFGLSSPTSSRSETGADVTKENQSLAGTPIYMAPEMIRGGSYGEEVDMWSAGVLLYVLLSGRNPYSGVDTDIPSIENAILYRHISFSGGDWDSVSVSAKLLAQGLLCRDPESRLRASEALRHPWINQIHR